MKISLNWVGDYVDISDLSADKVAELLSLHTAEVEGVETFGESIQDVVVGHVVQCGQHPGADKLSLTLVEYGGEEPVPVVCGAPNVREGLKIAFAPVGSKLPGNLKIKKAKLRGEVSRGMICSERELEMSDEHNGILELPEDAPIGERLIDCLGMVDSVLELDNKSLTHRPDLWGHYGFARELSVILDRPLKPLDLEVAWPTNAGDWKLKLSDAEGCPQYGAVEIDLGGTPGLAPAWMRNRLQAVEQRPVSDIVDITNYVLLEIGQPTHAFDADTLRGRAIEVRAAQDGERFTTLDGVERTLDQNDLVIADGECSVALAGVMGGLVTEVTDSTTKILLESAVFHPTRIRRTAQRLALRSEASTRFEKSLDPAYTEQATARFTKLLLDMRSDAKVLSAPQVEGDSNAPHVVVQLDPARTSQLLGIEMDRAAMTGILQRLGFGVEDQGQELAVTVPSWRATKDVSMAIDLVEEVGRIYGYNRIQAAPLDAPVTVPVQQPLRLLGHQLVQRLVNSHGAFETQSYSFLDNAWANRLGLTRKDFVCIGNPVQAEVELMRRDPIPSLLEQAVGNLRENPVGRLCELAKGYEPVDGALEPQERRWLAVVEWTGKDTPREGQESLFARLRGVSQDLMRSLNLLDNLKVTPVSAEDSLPAWAHPVQSLNYHVGETFLGWSGRVHPQLQAELEFERADVGILLLDLQALAQVAEQAEAKFTAPSKFPGIKVDIALALPQAVAYDDVVGAIRKSGGKFLDTLELFDVYTGPGLEDGQRSLAFRSLLRSPERTLSDKEERKFLQKMEQVAVELGGNLRS
ncbi:MAG: phenylalanine--tRNA ligase subunit beta [Planctomycetes bacterium]|nr:phenylalanine--tRNA ligase subunit beta [Planctomycetota bacterium]MCP4771619.1 phenylalanine--tRNA ligase subunit beta [Planctomycetota bacterium]MCP4860081.1 phenylalanine--tRNA ligase subunit beta [Planctomycetota bacterium]